MWFVGICVCEAETQEEELWAISSGVGIGIGFSNSSIPIPIPTPKFVVCRTIIDAPESGSQFSFGCHCVRNLLHA
jgi:hypothetical protein